MPIHHFLKEEIFRIFSILFFFDLFFFVKINKINELGLIKKWNFRKVTCIREPWIILNLIIFNCNRRNNNILLFKDKTPKSTISTIFTILNEFCIVRLKKELVWGIIKLKTPLLSRVPNKVEQFTVLESSFLSNTTC